MTAFAAFLRGVNLGRRTVRSADLRAAFEEMGFAGARTLLASGNVLFEGAGGERALRDRIEAGLAERFGFDIGTVLRTVGNLAGLVAADPFGGRTEDAHTKLHVNLFAETLPADLVLSGIAGDCDIVGRTAREVFVVAHRLPNGRYGPGQELLVRQFPKANLVTNRNWNTVLKAVA